MTKNPEDYADGSSGAYDYYAWWKRPKGNSAYNSNTHFRVWEIFQENEFWDRRLNR